MIVWEAGCQYNGSFTSKRLSIQFFPHFMGIGIDWKFLARRNCTMGVQQYQRERIWCLWSDLNNKTCKMHHCQLHVPGTLSSLNICGHQFWIWEKSTIFRIKFKFVNINGPTHQYLLHVSHFSRYFISFTSSTTQMQENLFQQISMKAR